VDYKGCTVYKDLQKKIYPPFSLKQYTPSVQINQTLYTLPGVTYAQITKQNSYAPTNIEQEPHIHQFHRQTSDIQELKKYDEKPFWRNRNYAKPPHNRAY
jgi:hypothetical protein